MAEWSIAAVLKTVELRGSGGSNPIYTFFISKSRMSEVGGMVVSGWRLRVSMMFPLFYGSVRNFADLCLFCVLNGFMTAGI